MTICHNNSIPHNMSQTHQLTLPNLALDSFSQASTSTYTTTHREGGIRLQEQIINDKHIYHNYGQGQSQFALAYGCSYIASKMITLKKQINKNKEVAVIGGNVNGLMTTLQLIKRGHRVNLYVKKLPVVNKKGSPKTVSGGQGLQFWYPCDYDNCDPLKHELIAKLSFQFLQQCIHSNRYQSVKPVTVYSCGPKSQQLRQNITQFITKQVNQLTLAYPNNKIQPLNSFTSFKTVLINTQLFIQEVSTELKLRNVNIIEKQFNSLNQILALNQQFVYNCQGIQSKILFGDQSVSQVVNFNVSIDLKPDNNNWGGSQDTFVMWVSSEIENQDDYVMYFTKKKVQISSKNRMPGYLTENKDKVKDKILSKAYHYIKQRTIKPYKL